MESLSIYQFKIFGLKYKSREEYHMDCFSGNGAMDFTKFLYCKNIRSNFDQLRILRANEGNRNRKSTGDKIQF
jgi:hypothetical protein